MSYTMPSESSRTRRPERRVRVWDIALTVVLLVLLALFALAASYGGFLLAFASDACSSQTCDFDLLNVGFWVAVASPWVLLVIAVATGIVRLVALRVAFWIPLVAAALVVAMWFVGAAIVGTAVSATGVGG